MSREVEEALEWFDDEKHWGFVTDHGRVLASEVRTIRAEQDKAVASGEAKAYKFCAGFQEARIRLRKESGCECALKELENQKMIWESKAKDAEARSKQ